MKDHTRQLLATRALLASAVETLDRLSLLDDDTPASPDDREIVAVSAMIAAAYRPRSRADALRFVEAIKAGDEAWLIVHSIPGEHRAEAAYHSRLSPELRRAVDG